MGINIHLNNVGKIRPFLIVVLGLFIFCVSSIIPITIHTVHADAETNIVLHKPITASNFVAPYTPERAGDGSTSPTSRWYSNVPGPQWLQVDLQGKYSISSWNVAGMSVVNGWGTDRDPGSVQLLKSMDGTNWTRVSSIPFIASYLKLVVVGNQINDNWTSIVEFTVNGHLSLDSTAPLASDITVTNNPAPTPDTVTVTGLNASDVIKVYDSATGGNLLGTATVVTGQTFATVSVGNLGTGAGQVYVSVTSTGKTESTRTAAPYGAEQVPSTAPLASNITVTNNNLVNVNGLTGGDTVKVYDSATGGNMLGSYTLAAGETFATVSVGNLGTGAGQIYVTVTSTGKTESTRTAVSFGSGADTTAPVTKYHFDKITGTSNGQPFIKGFTVSLQATDIGSGVKSTLYKINDGSWITYTNPFTIYAGTTHTVEYYSTDNAGNEELNNFMNFDLGSFIGAGRY
jgi:hypothetical protein